MISSNAYAQALPLTQVIFNKSLGIAPVEHTPLYQLVSASNIEDNLAISNDSGDVNTDLNSDMFSKQTDYEQHNKVFDETVQLLSTAVTTHISNAKNIVLPIVVEVAENIIKNMETDVPKIETYKLIQKDLPEPMKNDSFKESLFKAAGGIYANPESSFNHTERGPEALLELMLTGSNEYDEKIRTWVASKGDGFFNKLWGVVFMSPTDSGADSNPLALFETLNEGCDYALGAYLISRKLLEEVPQDTGMTLTQYTKLLNQVKDAAAVRIDHEYESHTNNVKNGILVLTNNTITREVVVHAGTYFDYIKNGGKNEIIFGALISGNTPYTVVSMQGREAEFQEVWDRFNLFNKTSIKNKALTLFKQISLSVFANSLNDLTNIEKDPAFQSGHVETCLANAEKYIDDTACMKDLDDIYDFALRLVCGCRFFFTDAEKILTSIKRITTENPEIDVREAALVATTEYLIDYISDQMKII